MVYIVSYFIGMSFIGLMLMWLDKRWAIKGKQRVPERTLIIFALFGSSVGMYVGMRQFRHKTKKTKFKFGIPIIMLLQVTIIFILFK